MPARARPRATDTTLKVILKCQRPRRLTRTTTTRRLRRVRCRRTTRRITRGHRPKDPDLWPKILFALRRTIRLHRRLMKIAPTMFDYGIRTKLEREREERARRWREIKPILDKVYASPEPGTDNRSLAIGDGPSAVSPAVPRHLNEETQCALDLNNSIRPAKRRRIEQLYTEWELWMGVAKDLQGQAEAQRRPALPRFSTVCNMLDVAFTLGRLATGLETNLKHDPAEALYQRDVNEDLERAYGNPHPQIG